MPLVGSIWENWGGGQNYVPFWSCFPEVEKRDWRNVKKWHLSVKVLKLKGNLTVENHVENVNNSL